MVDDDGPRILECWLEIVKYNLKETYIYIHRRRGIEFQRTVCNERDKK